jgi:hypothetical protein
MILKGQPKRASIEEGYAKIKAMLGKGGASEKVAQSLLKTI